MPLETDFCERFLKSIPQLLKNAAIAKEVQDSLGERNAEMLDRLQNRIALDAADEDDLFDAAYNAFKECADTVLTFGWDGKAPGMSERVGS
jgi:hypothetical protein